MPPGEGQQKDPGLSPVLPTQRLRTDTVCTVLPVPPLRPLFAGLGMRPPAWWG